MAVSLIQLKVSAERRRKKLGGKRELKFEMEREPEPLLESGGRCALGFPSFSRPGKLKVERDNNNNNKEIPDSGRVGVLGARSGAQRESQISQFLSPLAKIFVCV